MNSQSSNQSNNPSDLSNSAHQRTLSSIQDKQDIFGFLKNTDKASKSSSFFSKNGLREDIIQLTNAEADIPLEVFYALYHALWPQIEKQPGVSLRDAWTKFIGGSVFKGSLCPPEKLIAERKRDIIDSLSSSEGEKRVFQELDQVVNSILHLKQKIIDYPGQIFQKAEIMASFDIAVIFYKNYREKMKTLVQKIIEKENMNLKYRSEEAALEDLLEPKAIMMSDVFSHHWAYRISRKEAQKLLSLDMYGRIIRNSLSDGSTHPVVALPDNSAPLVYFKANAGSTAIRPEKEFMLYSLYRRLQIPVPETALLILTDVLETKSSYFYAVQASEAVNGESAEKNKATTFDEKAYALQVIGALLTNPSDGSFKNFKYSPNYKTLISIDNDMVFKPELIGDKRKVVNVKSILYLLPQIGNQIPTETQTFFTTLDPHLIILSWLHGLAKKNREYQVLFTRLAFQNTRCTYQNLLPENQTPDLFTCLKKKIHVDSEIHGNSFYPEILLSKDLLNSLLEKLQIIEKTIEKNGSATMQALFEEISPSLGKYYRKLRLEFDDPEEALEAVWGDKKKNGVDYSYISSLLNSEELSQRKNESHHSKQKIPEKFSKEIKNSLYSGETPLDRFIKRQNSRRRKKVLNLRVALEELQLLIQEGLTNSQDVREIVDFCHNLSKIADYDQDILKEIISLLSNLPHGELKWLLILEKYFLRADHNVPKDLKSSSLTVFGAFMKQRTFILTESGSRYLFDQQGDIKKHASLTGRSLVTFFPEGNPEFYLKQYPEWPGYEFASALFMRLFGVTQLPYHDLIIINSKYPVLLTQKVAGSPVHRVWQNPEAFNSLDPFHTGLLIICAMLLNPEDGKEDNFILSQDRRYLIPIDNDHCFLPSFSQNEASFWNAWTVNTALQTKTLLFCLDEMKRPLDPRVKSHIRSIDFDKLFISWLTELDKLESRFNNLIDQNQREKFLEQDTVMSIPFYKQFIHNIHWKAHKIKDILEKSDESTPFDLLKAVEPFAARCYADSFNQGTNLQSRFKAATNKLYTKTEKDGSRVSILNTRSMMKINHLSEKDLQKNAMFQRMGSLDSLDILEGLILKHNERAKIEQDFLCELNDKNKEGIIAFIFGNPVLETALKDFLASEKEGLLLRGSKFITSSKLRELFKQAPNQGMKIRFLALPDSPLLGEKEIRILAEGCPNLEYLNVSGCGGLMEIVTERREWPLLARLEAKQCLSLGKFVSFSPIKILRIETSRQMNIHIEKLAFDTFMISIERFGFNFRLTKGEEFELKLLEKTISNYNFFRNEEEEMKKDIGLMNITTEMYTISSRDHLAIFLTVIDLRDSNLKTEDIQRIRMLNLINLKRLELSRNKLDGADYVEYLIQADWPKLTHLNLSDNKVYDEGLKILAKGNWPLLEVLNLQETKLAAAGIETLVKNTKWPQLKNLDISENEINGKALATLCQGDWPLLETLNLGNLSITKKSLLKLLLNPVWPNFKEINMNGHGKDFANSLLQKNWSLLEKLNLSYEEIIQDEIEIIVTRSKWPQLKHLNLSGNEISDEALEILCKGNWPQLETLNLHNTGSTKKKKIFNFLLNINWPNLREINFEESENNFVNSLLQKNWPFLEELDLSYSEITKTEIKRMVERSRWPRLKHLNLSSNYELNDEVLQILCLGNWPQVETLNLDNTNITKRGLLKFLLNINWPKFQSITLPNDWKNVDATLVDSLIQKDLSLIEKLEFNNLKLTSAELERILKEYKCLQLKSLNISNNDISFEEGTLLLALGECSLLEELHIENIKLTPKGFETIVNESKLSQLKCLNISNNEIFDEGISASTHAHWQFLEELNLNNTKITKKGLEILVNQMNQMKLQKLKKLDISENIIGDEGLQILASAELPSFEHLVYSDTQVTRKGHFSFLEEIKWPNLIHLEHSLNESFYNYNERQDQWSPSEIILAAVPMCYKKQSLMVVVLDINWLNSKEIYLSITHQGVTEKMMLLPRNKLDQLASINISLNALPKIKSFQSIRLPSSVKTLDFSNNSLSDQHILESLLMTKCPELESLCLSRTNLTSKSLEIFASKLDWSTLKKLDISHNTIQKEGLEILSSKKLPLLEDLNVAKMQINAEGINILISQSNWPNLKKLDLSCNPIQNEGLATVSCKKWLQLEVLCLQNISVTGKGIENMVNVSDWPSLKILDLSLNKNIFDEELKSLAVGKWPELEVLSLKWTNIGLKDVESLVHQSSWEKLKEIHFRGLTKRDEVDPIKTLILEKWPDVKTDDMKSRI